MEPLRIGIIGAARIAPDSIVTPAKLTGARLVGIASRDRGRAEAFAAAHGVERVLDSYADVIADPEVEAIYNPLANGLHAPWNLAAIAAGKHVLSEKPFASNAVEAAEVRDAGRRAAVVVADGSTTCTARLPCGSASSWRPASSDNSGMSRCGWSTRHPTTMTPAGRTRSLAVR